MPLRPKAGLMPLPSPWRTDMRSLLHLEVSFDDDGAIWAVGAISQWGERIELARSSTCSPFTTQDDVQRWLQAMWKAWTAPALGAEASESLHDAYVEFLP